jgi:Tol biopolymer transport system component
MTGLAAAWVVLPSWSAPVAPPEATTAAQPLQPAPKRYTIEQFMATTSVRGASFSADEKRILFSSNASGIYNVYSQDVAGGQPVALTHSITDSHNAVSYFPEDDRVLFSRDKGGNEQNHLLVLERDGSERDLTPGDSLTANFEGWSTDGKAFFVSSNERNPKFFDLYRYDSASYGRALVFQNDQGLQIADVSGDGQWIALGKVRTTSDSDVLVYNVTSREMTPLYANEGPAGREVAGFDPASKTLLLLNNAGSEFKRLQRFDLASGVITELESADWDIAFSYYSRNGRYRVTGVNADASVVLKLVEGPQGTPVTLPRLPGGEIRGVSFSRSAARMAFYVNGDRSPSDLYVYDFASHQVRALSHSLSPDIDPADLVDTQVVRFASFDGLEIPSIYYLPKEASATRKVPACCWSMVAPVARPRAATTPSPNT